MSNIDNNLENEVIKNERNELISSVKKICDKLRTVMEVNEYRNYVLGFLFYKYLSEKVEQEVESMLEKKDFSYKDIERDKEEYQGLINYIIDNKIGFYMDYKYTFQYVSEMIDEGKDIIDTIEQAFKQIERSSEGTESEGDFKGLFKEVKLDDSKLGTIERDRESTIKFIIKEFSKLHLSFNNNEDDVFGNAYEYLLSEFASDGGKKAGEFYTPSSVAELLVRIASHNKHGVIKTAYDPACGSGSLLLKLTKKTEKYNKIFGQEVKSSTFNLARMNLFLRGLNYSNFDIREGDTLINPQHLNEEKFECIVANPPFSLDWNPNAELEADERYNPYPALAPKNKADLAFLQHMLHHVDPNNGIIASVFSLGVLERGNAEQKIRKFIVDKNYIDAIIVLPSRMFFNTSIPSCIIVARKNKKENTDVLFIDGTNEFEVGKRQNSLSEQNIQKIYQAWADRKDIAHFSRVVPLSEIQENDYSLSVSKYIEPAEEEQEEIDIDEVNAELARINQEIQELEAKFEKNLAIFNKNNQ